MIGAGSLPPDRMHEWPEDYAVCGTAIRPAARRGQHPVRRTPAHARALAPRSTPLSTDGGRLGVIPAGLAAQARARGQRGRRRDPRHERENQARRVLVGEGDRDLRVVRRHRLRERPDRLVADGRAHRDADPRPGPIDVALVVERDDQLRQLALGGSLATSPRRRLRTGSRGELSFGSSLRRLAADSRSGRRSPCRPGAPRRPSPGGRRPGPRPGSRRATAPPPMIAGVARQRRGDEGGGRPGGRLAPVEVRVGRPEVAAAGVSAREVGGRTGPLVPGEGCRCRPCGPSSVACRPSEPSAPKYQDRALVLRDREAVEVGARSSGTGVPGEPPAPLSNMTRTDGSAWNAFRAAW